MQPIIEIRNLGKQYRVGTIMPIAPTLREALASALMLSLTRRDKGTTNGNGLIWALNGISFDVAPGEVVGIVGRNGAGKSTLLKIISRIVKPTTGEVNIYGGVGSLLEIGTGFHPDLTGRENIFLNGTLIGMNRREIRAKFDEIVAFAEIEKFLETPVKYYSSGMYLRLAFAIAAHFEPQILLLDEVLAVGDIAFQQKCLAKMKQVRCEGRTVFFVSHDLMAIQQLCTRALLIESGRLIDDGDPKNVSANYVKRLSLTQTDQHSAG